MRPTILMLIVLVGIVQGDLFCGPSGSRCRANYQCCTGFCHRLKKECEYKSVRQARAIDTISAPQAQNDANETSVVLALSTLQPQNDLLEAEPQACIPNGSPCRFDHSCCSKFCRQPYLVCVVKPPKPFHTSLPNYNKSRKHRMEEENIKRPTDGNSKSNIGNTRIQNTKYQKIVNYNKRDNNTYNIRNNTGGIRVLNNAHWDSNKTIIDNSNHRYNLT